MSGAGAAMVGSAAGANGSTPTRTAAETIPAAGTSASLVERNGIPSRVTRTGGLSQQQTRQLIRDLNALTTAPKGPFACPADSGHAEIAHFTGAGGHNWTMRIGSCGTGLVDMTSNGKAQPTLESSKALLRDLHSDFASIRPVTEHVPSSLHNVTIHYEVVAEPSSAKTVTVTEAQAAVLVRLFNHLRVQPRSYVHCDLVGGPTYTVTFTGAHHTWTADEAACSNIEVRRDGTSLPTLLPSPAYDRAVRQDLKHDAAGA
jgi:hypothetical protein